MFPVIVRHPLSQITFSTMTTLASNHDFSKLPGLSSGHTTNADNPFEPFFGPVSVQDGQQVKAGDVFSHESK